MQSVTVEGFLGRDPSILAAQEDGRKRAAFSLGETTRFKRADGTAGERTTWFDCVCFNEGTAENYIGAFARKGSRVVVQGHVEENRWTGRDGVEHFDHKLIVGEIRISNRRDTPPQSDSQTEPARAPGRGRRTKLSGDRPANRKANPQASPADVDEEIPF
jgi:single stranded DNA-binding protein